MQEGDENTKFFHILAVVRMILLVICLLIGYSLLTMILLRTILFSSMQINSKRMVIGELSSRWVTFFFYHR